MEKKSANFTLTKMDEKEGRISGYASVYTNVDNGFDQVMPGAFTESVKAINAGNQSLPILWQHRQDEPIGMWDIVADFDDRLEVSGKLIKGVTRADDTYKLLEAGAVNGLSIGYRTTKATKNNGVREIREAKLFEVSVVTFPMNELARVNGVKSDFNLEDVKAVLIEGGFDEEVALAVAEHGFDGAMKMLGKTKPEPQAPELTALLTKLQGLKETMNA